MLRTHPCLVAVPASGQRGLHHHIQRGDTRNHPKKLADITQRVLAHLQHIPRLGADQLKPSALMLHTDTAARRQVVAIQRAQQCALARAGMTVQHQAFPGADGKAQALQDVEHHTVLLMQREGFREVLDLDQRVHQRHLVVRADSRSPRQSGLQHRGHQQLRIRVLRVVKDLIRQPGLHHMGATHND